MAGHSKWANIKHRKGAQDAKRSKIFTKIIKELTISAKEGGIDPESNPRLRMAIANAKGANMPKSTMEKAINKASDSSAQNYEEVTYEGYASHGVAVFVECTTDNLNRTVSNVRAAFNKYNGTLGTNGSLSFIFERKAIFILIIGENNSEELTFELIEAGAEDVEEEDGKLFITTSFEMFGSLQKVIEKLNITVETGETQRIPNDYIALGKEDEEKVLKLISALEDVEDVQNVFHNLEITE